MGASNQIVWIAALVGVTIVALVVLRMGGGSDDASSSGANIELSALALEGKVAFDRNCAVCHGQEGRGTTQGPPLVHDIYNPGHHGDPAFIAAARRGVRSHHWSFGDMPPQPQVTDAELQAIIRYVRELQEANGIFYKPHVM